MHGPLSLSLLLARCPNNLTFSSFKIVAFDICLFHAIFFCIRFEIIRSFVAAVVVHALKTGEKLHCSMKFNGNNDTIRIRLTDFFCNCASVRFYAFVGSGRFVFRCVCVIWKFRCTLILHTVLHMRERAMRLCAFLWKRVAFIRCCGDIASQ